MSKFYIFQENQFDSDMVYEKINGKYQPVVIEAPDKDEALNIYLKSRDLEEDRDLYFASNKKKYDEEKAFLKEAGYDSWEDYHNAMYPERPIEI